MSYQMNAPSRVIISLTGSSGVQLALRFIKKIPKSVKKYVITSENAKLVLKKENKITYFKDSDISACIASGSFKIDAMVILPCSTNTLSKIACGISDNLTTRAASVTLKESRKLLIAPREMPLNTIVLKNIYKLSKAGVIVAPPILGYYANPKTLKQMEDFLIGKWFDLLGIEHNLFRRWNGN